MKKFLQILVILNLIILFHEGGHYLAMRSVGMRTEEVSFGMGSKLVELGRLADGTPVNVRAIPLGGYVSSEQFGHLHEQGWVGASEAIAVAIAGPLGNIVFAELAILLMLAAWMVYATVRYRVPSGRMLFAFGKCTHDLLLKLPAAMLKRMFAIPVHFLIGVFTHPIQTLGSVRGPLYILFGKGNAMVNSGTADIKKEIAEGQTGTNDDNPTDAGLEASISIFNTWASMIIGFSLAIGGFNLIPLMPLDGGHAVMSAIYQLFGSTAASVFTNVSIWPILFLLGVVMAGDYVRLFREAFPRRKKTS